MSDYYTLTNGYLLFHNADISEMYSNIGYHGGRSRRGHAKKLNNEKAGTLYLSAFRPFQLVEVTGLEPASVEYSSTPLYHCATPV